MLAELVELLDSRDFKDLRSEELGDINSDTSERQRLGNFEECTLVGFEFKKGEECNEVSEIECYNVNVTKYNYELRERCETLVDHQCHLVTVETPHQLCQQSVRNM